MNARIKFKYGYTLSPYGPDSTYLCTHADKKTNKKSHSEVKKCHFLKLKSYIFNDETYLSTSFVIRSTYPMNKLNEYSLKVEHLTATIEYSP